MAEINVVRKNSVWPLIIAAVVVVLLIWALLAMMGRDASDTAPVAPVATDPTETAQGTAPTTAPFAADTPDARATATATTTTTTPEQRDAALDRYAGTYGSGNRQLVLNSAGSYTLRDSPPGEGQGRWSYDPGANVLHLAPADGSPDRYFRAEGTDTLTPLNPEGDPAAQMAPLQRVVEQ